MVFNFLAAFRFGAPLEIISSVDRTLKPSATIRAANFSISVASLKPRSARAWPALSAPEINFCCTLVGKFIKRIVLEINGRERPSFAASSSCVQLKSVSNCEYAAASSSAFNWLR